MILSREDRNYLRATLIFFEYLKDTLDYNPVDHPKVRVLFDKIRPLNNVEADALLLRLRDGDLGVTMDQLMELTGKDRSVIGRILARARVKPQLIYDFDDVQPYLKMKQGLVFGDTHDITSTTKENIEDDTRHRSR